MTTGEKIKKRRLELHVTQKDLANRIGVTADDFGAVCNCAVRYCLGRRSYMPSLVCGYITPLLPELTDKTLDCFERDIAERKRTGFDFGDSCDYETWDAFYKAVCNEIEGRKVNADM